MFSFAVAVAAAVADGACLVVQQQIDVHHPHFELFTFAHLCDVFGDVVCLLLKTLELPPL